MGTELLSTRWIHIICTVSKRPSKAKAGEPERRQFQEQNLKNHEVLQSTISTTTVPCPTHLHCIMCLSPDYKYYTNLFYRMHVSTQYLYLHAVCVSVCASMYYRYMQKCLSGKIAVFGQMLQFRIAKIISTYTNRPDKAKDIARLWRNAKKRFWHC